MPTGTSQRRCQVSNSVALSHTEMDRSSQEKNCAWAGEAVARLPATSPLSVSYLSPEMDAGLRVVLRRVLILQKAVPTTPLAAGGFASKTLRICCRLWL